jgi:predicted nucleic-acid-binding Zn-ribbon protein
MALLKDDPEEVHIGDRELQCLVCGKTKFVSRKAQLNTALATLFRLDWTNESALCVVCADCGYIHWFVQ